MIMKPILRQEPQYCREADITHCQSRVLGRIEIHKKTQKKRKKEKYASTIQNTSVRAPSSHDSLSGLHWQL